jgi:hypothetical protein
MKLDRKFMLQPVSAISHNHGVDKPETRSNFATVLCVFRTRFKIFPHPQAALNRKSITLQVKNFREAAETGFVIRNEDRYIL